MFRARWFLSVILAASAMVVASSQADAGRCRNQYRQRGCCQSAQYFYGHSRNCKRQWNQASYCTYHPLRPVCCCHGQTVPTTSATTQLNAGQQVVPTSDGTYVNGVKIRPHHATVRVID